MHKDAKQVSDPIKINDGKPANKIILDRDAYPVTRVEVVDNDGRAYTKHNVENVWVSFQNDYKTLKLMVTSVDDEEICID